MATDLPDNCNLRPARAEDMDTIRALVRAEELDPTQLRWEQFWVIACDGEVVACGQLRNFPGAQELGSLVVAPEWRGRGLGAALMEQLVAEASKPLYLECPAHMADYYAGFGFVPVAWRTLPPALKAKFGLSKIASAVFGWSLVLMHYEGQRR